MKSKRFLSLAALLALTLAFQSTATAAYIDTAAPYNGQYLVAYTPAAWAPSTTGSLSVADDLASMDAEAPAAEMTASADASALAAETPAADMAALDNVVIKDTEVIDGQTYYEAEPSFPPIDPAVFEAKSPGLQASLMQEPALALGEMRTFSTLTNDGDTTYTLTAQLMAIGARCNVFVENTYAGDGNPFRISYAQASTLAAEYDRVSTIMQNDFGPNITNNDGKIVILLQDIKEYVPEQSLPYYIAGYFWTGDYLLTLAEGGNDSAMIHIDIKTLMYTASGYDITEGYSTMVHEFQHMINFTDTWNTFLRTGTPPPLNDTWMNEMMSMAAEHMMYNTPLYDRIDEYNSSSKVQNGAVLTYNDYDVNGQGELGANYGLPYLFGQYLRVQTTGLTGGGDGIYKRILQSDYTNYNAVTQALASVGYGVTNFDTLAANFRIATYLNESYGYYGFRGNSAFNGVHAPLYTGSGTILAPGAAIIKALPGGTFSPSGASTLFMAFSADTDGIRVYKSNGDTVTTLTGGQTINISACYSGIQSTAIPTVVAGLYSSEGKMLRLWAFTGTPGAYKTSASLTLPQYASGCRLKIFYLDGSAAAAPVYTTYQIG